MNDIFEKALVSKAMEPVNMEMFAKGRRAQIGEIRDWGGTKYQKTQDGWKPVKQGSSSPKPEQPTENKRDNGQSWEKEWTDLESKLVEGAKKVFDASKKESDASKKVSDAIMSDQPKEIFESTMAAYNEAFEKFSDEKSKFIRLIEDNEFSITRSYPSEEELKKIVDKIIDYKDKYAGKEGFDVIYNKFIDVQYDRIFGKTQKFGPERRANRLLILYKYVSGEKLHPSVLKQLLEATPRRVIKYYNDKQRKI